MSQASSNAEPDVQSPSGSSPSEPDRGDKAHSESRAKHAERCLDRARSIIDSTGRLLLAWSLTMPVLWIYKLEPRVADVHAAGEDAEASQVALLKVHDEIQDRIAKQPVTEKLGPHGPTRVFVPKKEGERREIARTAIHAVRTEERLAEKIPLDPLGLKLELPLTQALLAWSGSLLWVIAYVAMSRARILNLFSQALRIQIAELGTPRSAVDDIASSSPWWLAPLPASAATSSTITRGDLSRALGWQRHRHRDNVAVIMFAVAAIAIQLRFCWLEATICRYADFSPLHAWALLILMVALLLATSWALWSWIRPAWISDRFTNEPGGTLMTRRDWIAGAIPILPAAILLLTLPRKTLKAVKRYDNPRFVQHARKASLLTSLSPGFHENLRSKIIHWVTKDQRIRRVSSTISLATLRDSSLSQPGMPGAGKPRVHLATASIALESAANQLFAAKDYAGACGMLTIAIEHDALLRAKAPKCRASNRVRRARKDPKKHQSQSFRLPGPKRPDSRIFDRLADISVRYGQPAFLKRAIDSITTARKSYDNDSFTAREIDARIAKWSNAGSVWNQNRR
jgi:hypothetical protein